MVQIRVLDSATIDQIAAGEVVERPASVVKELVENAVDAGAKALTVEIKEGGISFIRVTDNGSGIPGEQVRNAFLRHATSKIEHVSDLDSLHSLGFRGEALSSIAAVSQVEIITKTKEALTGVRLVLEGGKEKEFEEIGAPEGTTLLVRNLFYNTPVRRKFLKSPTTEGSYVADLMEHLALGNPGIAMQFIQNGKLRFATSGNGDLKDIIYRIYGREMVEQLLAFHREEDGLCLFGYLGKPALTRANRNFETYFINGRYIKDTMLAKAIEEGYSAYLMQHKYPFVVLHITLDPSRFDVNVHPTKMEVRFQNQQEVFAQVARMVREGLQQREMIPAVVLTEEERKRPEADSLPGEASLGEEKELRETPAGKNSDGGELSWQTPGEGFPRQDPSCGKSEGSQTYKDLEPLLLERTEKQVAEELPVGFFDLDALPDAPAAQEDLVSPQEKARRAREDIDAAIAVKTKEEQQMELFADKLLTREKRQEFSLVGQVFDTYWLVQYQDKLLIVDQHAAHEKVKYERLVKALEQGNCNAQLLEPPVILNLTGRERELLDSYEDYFAGLGFSFEDFGGNSVAIRSVPTDLYGCSEKQLFTEVLDELAEGSLRGNPKVITGKLASMACKAAVKGNSRLTKAEMEELLDEMLTLENPYHCPHGRPTMITMTQTELEKKFKRIV